MGKIRVLKPREAIRLARKLGWTVEPRRRTGEYLFVAPDGRRFNAQAPGRSGKVPLVLAKALQEKEEV